MLLNSTIYNASILPHPIGPVSIVIEEAIEHRWNLFRLALPVSAPRALNRQPGWTCRGY
jgi:hypothetical protein